MKRVSFSQSMFASVNFWAQSTVLMSQTLGIQDAVDPRFYFIPPTGPSRHPEPGRVGSSRRAPTAPTCILCASGPSRLCRSPPKVCGRDVTEGCHILDKARAELMVNLDINDMTCCCSAPTTPSLVHNFQFTLVAETCEPECGTSCRAR
jgi:hypothetical protein